MESIQTEKILTEIIEEIKKRDSLPQKSVLADDMENIVKERFSIKENWPVIYKFKELLKLVQDNHYIDDNERGKRIKIRDAIKFKIKMLDGVTWKYRSLALLIDIFIIAIAGGLLPKSFIEGNLRIYSIIFFLLYFILLHYYFNATIGQKIFKIKIIKNNGDKPTLVSIILRGLLFLTIFSGIGAIIFLIKGYYWDKATKLKLVFID